MPGNVRYFPDLQTERLILRAMCDEDLEFVFRQFSDPLVSQYLMDEPALTSYEEAQSIIDSYKDSETKNRHRWVALLKADWTPIGTCGFHRWDKMHRRAEIGYDTCPSYWGQGLMAEAVRAIIDSAFARMSLHRLDALVCCGNHRSINLLQKMGFQQEGLLRDYFCLNDIYYDHLIFGLLRSGWQAHG